MPKKSYHSKSWIWAFSSIYGTLLLCFFWESLKSPLPWSHTQWSEYLDLPWLGVSETSTTWTGCSMLTKKVLLSYFFQPRASYFTFFICCSAHSSRWTFYRNFISSQQRILSFKIIRQPPQRVWSHAQDAEEATGLALLATACRKSVLWLNCGWLSASVCWW